MASQSMPSPVSDESERPLLASDPTDDISSSAAESMLDEEPFSENGQMSETSGSYSSATESTSGSKSPSSSMYSSSSTRSSKTKLKAQKKDPLWMYYPKKLIMFGWKVFTSSPNEYKLTKMYVGFVVGALLAYGMYHSVIVELGLGPNTTRLIGGVMGLGLSAGFGTSVGVRCVSSLVIPSFFSSSGRSYIDTFAITYIIKGPVSNLMDNGYDITRSLICSTELSTNHTVTRWQFRVAPIGSVVQGMLDEGFMLNKIGRKINRAFLPIKREIRKEKEKNDEKKEKEKEKKAENEEEKEKKETDEIDEYKTADEIEKEYKAKLLYRCNDAFNKAVEKCKRIFEDLWGKCINAIPILGYAICWPMKFSFTCELIRTFPLRLETIHCEKISTVFSKGFGKTYKDEEDTIRQMDRGFNVSVQYKVIHTKEDMDYTSIEQMRQGTLHDFTQSRKLLEFILNIINRILAFTFLLVVFSAYKHYKKYQTDLSFDNVYITNYFREIDARRRAKDKMTLLPLKKAEDNTVIHPTRIKMSKIEKKKLVTRSLMHFSKILMAGLICLTDYLFYSVLGIIESKSSVDFHQKGVNRFEVNVNGTGFMSQIVRKFLSGLDSHHNLDQVTSNSACVPHPKKLEQKFYYYVFGIYLGSWLLLLLESYGHRLRRVFCAFFFRKREKMRVLFLYNNTMRKRKNFLKRMERKIKRKAKQNRLKQEVSFANILVRMCPRLGPIIKKFPGSKRKCLLCEEKERKTFHYCSTPGCDFCYCPQCWEDIAGVCYACLPASEFSSTSSSDEEIISSDDDE